MGMMGNMGNMGNMNMGMNMGMGMNSMNPNMPQQRPPPFLAIIYQSLTQSQQHDGPFQGWRANMSIQERAAQIKVVFDSLRMLGGQSDTRHSLDIALAFERKQFSQSQTQEAYKQSIHDKLAEIRDKRQQQVNGMPNNMMQQPIMSTPNMAQRQPQMQPGMPQNMNFGQQSMVQQSPMVGSMQQQPQSMMNVRPS